MNERRQKFCELYASCGNAAEAARGAGYSEKTARSQGNRLLTKADICDYIQQLRDAASSDRIASATEVAETFTDILRDEEQRAADRLKAGELLLKTGGDTLQPKDDDVTEAQSDDTVVIMLPYNGDGQPNAVELSDGTIKPFADTVGDVWIYLPYSGTTVEGGELEDDD